ncbi:MAG TPA: hypothetical protein VK960_08795 [Acidimicrobiia bacterium]|nr:hypothetical protein [Acidimicrobiia bacterium]
MKRVMYLAIALALVGAACGGSDSGTTTTAGGGTTSATTSPPAATTTVAAVTTTEGEVDPLDARLAIAESFAAEYEGEWTNTTFDSTGALRITNTQVTDFGTLMMTLDVDGSAFGGPDPDPQVVEVDLHPTPIQVLGFLGQGATLEVEDDGTWVVTAMPPGLDGATFMVEMTVTAEGFQGTYVINAPDGSLFAEGTFEASRTG